MFEKVLIANRGEVAIRINDTLEKLGVDSVGVYTHHDRDALHVQRIGRCLLLEDGEQTGYLNGKAIIEAAWASGAQAIHPGYGFLAENATFADACNQAGLVFIGPPAQAIADMGEKISARAIATKAGVPVVPGVGAPGMTDADLIEACENLEFPLLVKPAAGGGGKGLHVVNSLDELIRVLPTARREAKAAFADDSLLVEKFLFRARHIEFQVVADNFGSQIHLGERECSLQRRHQKVIEEAPSPLLTDSIRNIMGEAALRLTSAIGYRSLGTIEFLVDADSPGTFYFMEMNTRLQVEHRVTELITGLDLVECQLRLAAGDPLANVIPSFQPSGHAIEARIYAEDAANDFLPTGGTIGRFAASREPHTITDTAISDGTFVTSSFDPMLAKTASFGDDRLTALERLRAALSETVLLGVTTNIDFVIRLLDSTDFQDANFDTTSLEKFVAKRPTPTPELLASYANLANVPATPWSWRTDGWRLSGMPSSTVTGYIDGIRHDIPLDSGPSLPIDVFIDDTDYWIHHRTFGTWLIKQTHDRRSATNQVGDEISSPMPGVVIAVNVAVGDKVLVGDPLVVIEAMKMEHIVRARRSGQVTRCDALLGAKVRSGQLLVEVVEDVR